MQTSAAPSAAQMLVAMQGLSVTAGWDAVLALSVERVNALLLEQFLEGESGGIVSRIYLRSAVYGTTIVLDLRVGPPLIQFTSQPRQCQLTMAIVGGAISVEETSGGQTTLLQTLTLPSHAGQITGTLDLAKVAGVVENSHDVVVDLGSGSYTATVQGLPPLVAEALGPAITLYFQNQAIQYRLGTVIYTAATTSAALVPTSFDFATQVDRNGNQCLLLFIVTNGAASTIFSIDFNEGLIPIPSGYSLALILSSQLLFKQILLPQYAAKATVSANDPGNWTQAWSISITQGYVGLPGMGIMGKQDYKISESSIPLAGMTINTTNGQLVSALQTSWIVLVGPEQGHWTDQVRLNLTWNDPYTLTVTEPQETVSLADAPNPATVTYEAGDWQQVVEALQTSIVDTIQFALDSNLAAISVFALSNLLFPAEHVLTLQAGAIPGDLIIFGDVDQTLSVTPSAALLAPGASQQFAASLADAPAPAVTWMASAGSISTDGLYQAPPEVGPILQPLITARSGNNLGTALVTLMNPLVVCPAAAQLTAGTSQQFGTIIGGQAGGTTSWSVDPQIGTIAADGTYTAPATITQHQTVVVTAVDASNTSLSATATVDLYPATPLTLTPPAVTLAPGGTQQFSTSVPSDPSAQIAWNVVPALGSVSPSGLYTAPAELAGSALVTVIAQVADPSVLTTAQASVTLSPSTSA